MDLAVGLATLCHLEAAAKPNADSSNQSATLHNKSVTCLVSSYNLVNLGEQRNAQTRASLVSF